MKRIYNWIISKVWWRFHYKRVKISDKEAWNGRCLICHGGCKTNKNRDYPVCTNRNHPCPCEWNYVLKCRE